MFSKSQLNQAPHSNVHTPPHAGIGNGTQLTVKPSPHAPLESHPSPERGGRSLANLVAECGNDYRSEAVTGDIDNTLLQKTQARVFAPSNVRFADHARDKTTELSASSSQPVTHIAEVVGIAKDTGIDVPVAQIMAVHDEMERWIYTKPGGTLSEMEVAKNINECCEFAVLGFDDIKPYVKNLLKISDSEWAELDQLVDAIQRAQWAKLKGSLVFEIKVPPHRGGTRILGSYFLATKKLGNGDYQIFFAGYREKSTLMPVYVWLAANHDEWKVKQYLKGKLLKQIQQRVGSLQ